MPTRIEVPVPFLRSLQKLAKKYPAVVKQVDMLGEQLKDDQRPGDKVPGVGRDVYEFIVKRPVFVTSSHLNRFQTKTKIK